MKRERKRDSEVGRSYSHTHAHTKQFAAMGC